MRKNISKIQPSPGYVLLEILENEKPSSFIIADKDATPQRGKVLSIGDFTFHEGVDEEFHAPCKVGDAVIHSGYGYENIRVEGEQYRLCPFSKILAVIKK
jgi:co-chaperonin GroES (HSP10)